MSFTTSSPRPTSHLSLGATDFSQSFSGTAIPPPPPASAIRSQAPTTTTTNLLPTQEPQISNKPFIRRKPVQAAREDTPARRPSIPRTPSTLYGSRGNSPAGIGGPLSSHPITPVDSENTEAFPAPVQIAMTEASTNGSGSINGARPATNGLHRPHISGDSSDSNNFDPALPQQPVIDTSRRPSFVSRFMRIRSGSFMRSKSQLGKGDSATSLNHKENGNGSAAPSFVARSERGIKRPGSPMVSRSATSSGPQSNTFPRMVRKKSMELLGTARRKSGMFGREDDMIQSAIDEERAREAARAEYMRPHDKTMKEVDDRQSEEIRRLEEQRKIENQRRYEELRKRDPAPTIQLNGLSALDGDDMFRDIGR